MQAKRLPANSQSLIIDMVNHRHGKWFCTESLLVAIAKCWMNGLRSVASLSSDEINQKSKDLAVVRCYVIARHPCYSKNKINEEGKEK